MVNNQSEVKTQYYSWDEYRVDVKKIFKTLQSRNWKFDGVFAPPRGGLVLAVTLSNLFGNDEGGRQKLPLILHEKDVTKNTLIVDDIADTGATLLKYQKKRNIIVTLFKHAQSQVDPQIWIREKEDRWIEYPWEVE